MCQNAGEESKTLSDITGIKHINWYPGHMKKAFDGLQEQVAKNHVIIEVRDARIPISSGNPLLEDLVDKNHQKTRIVVLNKSDLCDPLSKKAVQLYFEEQGQQAVYVNAKQPGSIQALLEVVKLCKGSRFKTVPTGVLVVGVPNVGKSSIINCFRNMSQKRSAAKVGKLPGVTRKIGGFLVSESPPIFVVDTPGIMLPRFEQTEEGLEQGLKLGLTGAIKDRLVGHKVLVRYLLHMLNTSGSAHAYTKLLECDPLSDPDQLLYVTANKLTRAETLTPAVEQRAAVWLLERFRDGTLGRLTLDNDYLRRYFGSRLAE